MKFNLETIFQILAWSYESEHYQWTRGLYNGRFELPNWARVKKEFHENGLTGGRDFFVIDAGEFDLWVFPGTLPTDWKDWWVNLQAQAIPVPVRGAVSAEINKAMGEVHRGAAGIGRVLDDEMNRDQKPALLIGHSQGFMSAINAAVWALDKEMDVIGVIGTGCPRVGNDKFIEGILKHVPVLPFYHSFDIVRFLPTCSMGYAGFNGLLLSENGTAPEALPGMSIGAYCPDGGFGQWFKSIYRKFRHGLKGGPVSDHDSTKYIAGLSDLLSIHAVPAERRIKEFLEAQQGGKRLTRLLQIEERKEVLV